MAIEKTQDIKRELVIIFFSQIRIIMGITLPIFVGAVVIAFFWPPTYAATGTILVKGKKVERSLEDLQETELRAMPVTKEDLFSEAQLLSSPIVAKRTVEVLRNNGFYESGMTEKEVADIADSIIGNVNIEVVPASNVLRITYYDKAKEAPAEVLNALMRQYIIYRLEVYNPDETEVFFSSLVDRYNQDLDEKEHELMALVEKSKGADPIKAVEKNLLVLHDLEVQLNILQTEAIEKELFIKRLENALASDNVQFFAFVENLVLQELSAKLIALVNELGNVERVYHSESVKVLSYHRQIDKMYLSLKNEVAAIKENVVSQYEIKRTQIARIENRINDLQEENIRLQRFLITSNKINRDMALLQFSQENFAKRSEEARINNSIEGSTLSSYVSIFGRPVASNSPVFPKKEIIIPFGLLVGFITGVAVGFMREFLDHTFKSPRDVELVTGHQVLLSIPEWVGEKT